MKKTILLIFFFTAIPFALAANDLKTNRYMLIKIAKPNQPLTDTDGDGKLNTVDADDDNDGIPDTVEQSITDSDLDGIPDVVDLDSDNDGIGDIIEDGWSALTNGTNTMNLNTPASGGTWVDANGNGWNDVAEAYYASGTAADFDCDGLPNYIDLDADNDSLLMWMKLEY